MIDTKYPFAWQVEKDGAVSFMIGTNHSLDDEVLTDEARRFAVSVDSVLTEFDFREETNGALGLLPEGTTIEDLLPEKDYDKIMNEVTRLFFGVFPLNEIDKQLEVVKNTKLWAIKTLFLFGYKPEIVEYFMTTRNLAHVKREIQVLSSSAYNERTIARLENLTQKERNLQSQFDTMSAYDVNGELFDCNILEYALDNGVQVVGLESKEESVVFADEVSLETQKILLLQSINNSVYSLRKEKPSHAFFAGDVRSANFIYNNGDDSAQEFYRVMADGRTQVWYPKVEPAVANGGVLLMTGVAHMIRDIGFVNMLQEDGYKVTRLGDFQ
ncbi:TraB/GumN family protein [Nanoarchaeota archaeon]